MDPKRSPQQTLQDERDRLGVSAQYDIDPDLEPDRQDQEDMNRLPSDVGEKAAPSKRTPNKLDEEE